MLLRLRGGGCAPSKQKSADMDVVVAVPTEPHPTRHPVAAAAASAIPVAAPAAAPVGAPASTTCGADAGSSLRSLSISFFGGDPDKAHDKKVAGCSIDPTVTATKGSLRRLRAAAEGAARLYMDYAKLPKNANGYALLMPELSEWTRHENFCGGADAADSITRDAAQLAAIAGVVRETRSAIGELVVRQLKEASRCAAGGLTEVCVYELRVREATSVRDAAAKALPRAKAAQNIAEADERRAEGAKDEKKREAGLAAARKALTKAESDVQDADAALVAVEGELATLATLGADAALRAARASRQEAEGLHLAGASEALAGAYERFALGVADVLSGARPAVREKMKAAKMRPTMKYVAGGATVGGGGGNEDTEGFGAQLAQCVMAQQRCELGAKQVGEWRKAVLETLLAPTGENAKLEALAAACEDPATSEGLLAISLPADAHRQARAACAGAAETLQRALLAFAAKMKSSCAAIGEHGKLEKAVRAACMRVEEAQKEVTWLETLGKPTDKRR